MYPKLAALPTGRTRNSGNKMFYRTYMNNIQPVNSLQCYVFFVSIFSCCFARDIIDYENPVRDGDTLVSAGDSFELGFFTPNGNSSRGRYVGIWYKFSPETVVWVANRDKPVPGHRGVFGIKDDGNLHVWDESNLTASYWSTEIETSSPNSTAKLMDSGNLVLGKSVWESFKYPTDTFLPGMRMQNDLKLTSWSGKEDPKQGNFIFGLGHKEEKDQYIINNKSVAYWKSGDKYARSAMIPDAILNMLMNFTLPKYKETSTRDYNGTRLVIMLNGTIAYKSWNKNNSEWVSIWSEPTDCSVYKGCGEFGVCNANSKLRCKCLPGFKAKYEKQWNSGDFSGGCVGRGIEPCGDIFLNLTMMNIRVPDFSKDQVNGTACQKDCLESCQCKAYSFQAAPQHMSRRRSISESNGTCSLWTESLLDVQEEYSGGQNISIRVASSDLDSTDRHCDPCGTNTVPFPLSTGPDCGDNMYFKFQCDISSGVLTFKTLSGEYKVLSINQDSHKFLIQVPNLGDCLAKKSSSDFQIDPSTRFSVTDMCYNKSGESSLQVSTNEVEIQWIPPLEPVCASGSDCKNWPNTSCRTADTLKRCLCNKSYQWNGTNLNCTRHPDGEDSQTVKSSPSKTAPLPLIVVPVVLSVVALACTSVCLIIWRKKKIKKHEKRRSDQRSKDLLKLDSQKHITHFMNSGEVMEEDEGIDVPFFNFESILAATNDFSDENKLGQGGYGPVYKGTFEDGQQIAVKRLSTASGQGLQEFKNEVVLIAKLQHRNLVRLRGYCIKGNEKILLYEYMPNKSLDSFIFDNEKSTMLDWEKRFNIILGIARGLLYLHQDSRLRIIHRDMKSSNVLLDQDMEPKISDFGLARIVGGKQTEASTNRVVGTYGYMSPEYALEGLFSVKSDVYSFGVVLLEIVSGLRISRLVQLERPLSLLSYAWKLLMEDTALDLMDPGLRESCKVDQFLKCVKVALLCVQEDPSERPTMSTIVTMLDSDSAIVPTPLRPAFDLKRGITMASSSSSTKPCDMFAEITVTLEEGR